MPTHPADPALLNHSTTLLYPFVHDLAAPLAAARLCRLEPRWRPWWARLGDAEVAEALEATGFFLPYVRGLLYPETAGLHDLAPGEHYEHWVAAVRERTAGGLAAFHRRLPPGPVLRLTCRAEAVAPLAQFTVHFGAGGGRGGREWPPLAGRLDWIDAWLFPSGLGFLALKVGLACAAPRLSQLIRLNAALRLVHPPSLRWSLPELELAGGERVRVRDLLDFLTDDLAGAPCTDTEAGRAYGEHCQLLSHACVHLGDADRERLPAGPFAGAEERLLFEYAACIGLGDAVGDPVWVPSRRQAERLSRDHVLHPWRCWRAMALKESLVFLATEDLGFTRRTLPRLVETDYLPLYLYTLYQKFQLSVFATDLMREVAQVEGHLRGARALLRRFVAFRNRFWFSEVTRKPQGGDLYRLLQQGLELHSLYQLVTASVKEAKEYYEERWDRQVRLVVTVLGVVGGPLAAAAGTARYLWAGLGPVGAALLLLALVAGAGAALLRWRRGGRRRNPQPARRPARLRCAAPAAGLRSARAA